jgi:uncharacterized protein YbjT (DUF2867 family)
MKIIVIGGSGLTGKKLVAILRERGQEAVAASPSSGVNTLTGEGVAEVLKGAQAVVDVSNSPSFEAEAVMEFFTKSAHTLLSAAAKAGIGHYVALSVVGADRMSSMGYMQAKVAQEKLIRESGVPYSIVRATQFFEFLGALGDAGEKDGVVRLSAVKMQPMAADDVAKALADVVLGALVNGIVEIAGPEATTQVEAVQRVLNARKDARKVEKKEGSEYFGAPVNDGALVPQESARLGAVTLDEWLRR